MKYNFLIEKTEKQMFETMIKNPKTRADFEHRIKELEND